jgi:hypothetical protein
MGSKGAGRMSVKHNIPKLLYLWTSLIIGMSIFISRGIPIHRLLWTSLIIEWSIF